MKIKELESKIREEIECYRALYDLSEEEMNAQLESGDFNSIAFAEACEELQTKTLMWLAEYQNGELKVSVWRI